MLDASQIMRQVLQAGRYDALEGQSFTAQQTNQAAVQSGQAMGFTLQVMEDPMADLMDSMEELSFQFEEKEMKTAGERKLGELRGPKSAYITAIQEWMKTLPDMPGGEFMERMLRQLRHAQLGGQTPNAQQLLKMLREGSGDPTHQFAMLDILEQALKPDEEELQKLLQQTKQTLNAEKGAEVRAGLNLAEQINAQAKSPEEMQNLRDLYRGEVLGFKSPQDCFRSLLATRGAGRLAESIEFLIKGAGVDLNSPSPSTSAEELHRVLGDLQCVNVLRTVMDKCNALAGKMASQFGETCLLNGEKMTGRIMDFTEMPFVNAGNVGGFISSCGIGQLLAQLYFCTELLNMFRGLSPRLFQEDADRFKLIDAGQEHLDGLVSLQEEAEQEEKEKKKKEDAA
ncbi:MAG: type III secretion system gatekeeper subunit SctW [Kiritimatiellae bacterium]|nr:type III secretion system gatekeeper subunit SctW [Kiritimatiellia bacterium]